MKNLNELLEELISENPILKEEIELLDIKYKIIDELINYRNTNDLTQTDFAERIGTKQQMISRFEKGEVDPRLSFVSKILKGMDKNIEIVSYTFIPAENICLCSSSKKTKKLIDSKNLVLNNNYKIAI